MIFLLADIGGTNTRCALCDKRTGELGERRSFRNRDASGLDEILTAYIAELPARQRPRAGFMAVAAPVRGDAVHMVNIDWQFSATGLRDALNLDSLVLLNDFEALAYALPALGGDQLVQVGGGAIEPGRAKCVLGPGTGLGVASLIRARQHWHAVGGEGGHVTLAASNDEEARLVARARERWGHCSAERLISGPGLEHIHELLHDAAGLDAAGIAQRADAGDGAAAASFEMFFRLLATVASNLALTLGASGGVYVAGGIIPRHLERFRASGFRSRFETKGRYHDYLARIPTFVITAENPTLLGLKAALGGPDLAN